MKRVIFTQQQYLHYAVKRIKSKKFIPVEGLVLFFCCYCFCYYFSFPDFFVCFYTVMWLPQGLK